MNATELEKCIHGHDCHITRRGVLTCKTCNNKRKTKYLWIDYVNDLYFNLAIGIPCFIMEKVFKMSPCYGGFTYKTKKLLEKIQPRKIYNYLKQ